LLLLLTFSPLFHYSVEHFEIFHQRRGGQLVDLILIFLI
jgi:hypothetical protein